MDVDNTAIRNHRIAEWSRQPALRQRLQVSITALRQCRLSRRWRRSLATASRQARVPRFPRRGALLIPETLQVDDVVFHHRCPRQIRS